MNRIAALFAIIAFTVMSTGMARAQPMAPMAPMAMSAHHAANKADDRQAPCDDMASLSCHACCIVIAPAVAIPLAAGVGATGFAPVDFLSPIGRIVPPALPPPRA